MAHSQIIRTYVEPTSMKDNSLRHTRSSNILKVRAWGTKSKEMYPWEEVIDFSEKDFKELFDVFSDSNFIPMYFTGATDIYGKEVYQGDVLRVKMVESDYNKSTEVREYQLVVSTLTGGAFFIDDDYCVESFAEFFNEENITTLAEIGVDNTINSYEVIGNIYQNPDLAKKYYEEGN
jgi:hypothetical protein